MVGTKAGGKKTKSTILTRFGTDYYRNIGRQGGIHSVLNNGVAKHGFGSGPQDPRKAGAKGGVMGRRSRNVRPDSKLLPDEIRLLVELAPLAWETAQIYQLFDPHKYYSCPSEYADEVGRRVVLQEWQWVFNDSGFGPDEAKQVWRLLIILRWAEHIDYINRGVETEENVEDYKALRALAKAYNITHQDIIKWHSMARRLLEADA